jgi:PatG Domain
MFRLPETRRGPKSLDNFLSIISLTETFDPQGETTMEQPVVEVQEHATNTLGGSPPPRVTPSVGPAATAVSTQACATCGAAPAANGGLVTQPSWVYALGNIEARFPSISVEKEFAQATGRERTAGLTDRQALHTVLTRPENRYLVRQLCFVLSVEGLETYLLRPRDPADFSLLVEAIRPNPSPLDLDVVIGLKGPIAPAEMCNGLMVPIVVFDQIYSFDRDSLIKAIPIPKSTKTTAAQFGPAAEELFNRIMQLTDNAGATDEHRALNYLVMRYPAIYGKAAEEFAHDFSLTGVEVRPSPLSSTRNIVDVIFSYTNRITDFTEKFFVRCDMTEEFPFLVSKMSPYYDR